MDFIWELVTHYFDTWIAFSIRNFFLQLIVYNYMNGPCYRCLYPTPPPPETVTNCSDGGVMGAGKMILFTILPFFVCVVSVFNLLINDRQFYAFLNIQALLFRVSQDFSLIVIFYQCFIMFGNLHKFALYYQTQRSQAVQWIKREPLNFLNVECKVSLKGDKWINRSDYKSSPQFRAAQL